MTGRRCLNCAHMNGDFLSKECHNCGPELCNFTPRETVAATGEPATIVTVLPGYQSLFDVLKAALDQAQSGKGKERHAQENVAFEDQPIIAIGRIVGAGFQNGQAIKKMVEAQGMVKRGELAAAEREILGAINYMAATVIDIRQKGIERG